MCAVSGPHAEQAQAGIEAVLGGSQRIFEMEYPCHARDQDGWHPMCMSPLVGHCRGAVVSHEDITPRWRLKQQRAGLPNELLNFMAALDAHAIVTLTDGQGRITHVNEKVCAVSKWERADGIGRTHRIINSGHHSKAYIRELWSTIRAGHIWRGELKNLAKDGNHYWVDTTTVPLMGADGKPYQYTAIRAEITQKKLLEERNAEVPDELLAANRKVREFVDVVSHDLKAPLRGISSLAAWLVEDHAALLRGRGRGRGAAQFDRHPPQANVLAH